MIFPHYVVRVLKVATVAMSKYQYQTINGKKDRVHRHVMSEHINRPLISRDHVYHINGDSTDNRIENLVLITKSVETK